MNVLLTAFEPFGGRSVNTTTDVVGRVIDTGVQGVCFTTDTLPVEADAGLARLRALLDEHQPDIAIATGESSNSRGLDLERVAINLLDFRIPDNAGAQPRDQPIDPDGPAAFFTNLPARRMACAAERAGCPAELSLSAGSFLCNAAFYTIMQWAALRPDQRRGGFVHLRALPPSGSEGGVSIDTLAHGLADAIGVLRDLPTV